MYRKISFWNLFSEWTNSIIWAIIGWVMRWSLILFISLTLFEQKPLTTDSKCHELDSNSSTSSASQINSWAWPRPQQNAITVHYFHICMQVPSVFIYDVSISVSHLLERTQKSGLIAAFFITEEVELILLWFACQGAKRTKKKNEMFMTIT